MFTVFTPTYNRKETLTRLYNSLICQNDPELVWLVIDDGSSDDTEKLINKFKKGKKIIIEYIFKENGGKMSAVNIAHQKCHTKYMITIDSDDMMNEGFIDRIKKDIQYVENEKDIAGIVYLASNTNGNVVGSKLPPDKTICKFYDIYNKYKCSGDKCIVWKSDVLKNYSYPLIDNEKFVPDGYLMLQISKDYSVMTMNYVGTIVEYLDSGYSNNYFELVKRNPKGTMLYYRELYNIDKSLYNIYCYLLFGIYAKVKFSKLLSDHPAKIWIVIMYPCVLILSKIRK